LSVVILLSVLYIPEVGKVFMEIENFFRIGYTMGFLRYGGRTSIFDWESCSHSKPLRGLEYSIVKT